MKEGIDIITFEVIDSKLSELKLMDENLVIHDIEEVIKEFSLTITQKTSLSTLKGSIHYHLKNGRSSGILEVTYWPRHKRLWVEIHNNRRSESNESLIKPFSERLAQQFRGQVIHRLEHIGTD